MPVCVRCYLLICGDRDFRSKRGLANCNENVCDCDREGDGDVAEEAGAQDAFLRGHWHTVGEQRVRHSLA